MADVTEVDVAVLGAGPGGYAAAFLAADKGMKVALIDPRERRVLEVAFAGPRPQDLLRRTRFVVDQARAWEESAGGSLRDYLTWVARQSAPTSRVVETVLPETDEESVRIMTVHAAKGLEFPVVVVADLGRDARADDGPLQVSRDGRVGLEVASLAGGRNPALELKRIREEQESDADAEERRIFYVAMTRAEQLLILSGATDVARWPEEKPLCAAIDWIHPRLAPGLSARHPGEPTARAKACAKRQIEQRDPPVRGRLTRR